MSSPAQAAANAANARLSTSPRTPAGKARSSQNARQHGLSARELIVRPEDLPAFESLQTDLTTELQPQGALEQVIFNQLLHAAWDQRRLRHLEAELFNGQTDPLADPAHTPALDRYARYQARVDRAFHRALRELKTLQTERAQRLTITAQAAEAMPPLASITELTKRSHRSDLDYEFAQYARQLHAERVVTSAFINGEIPPPPYKTDSTVVMSTSPAHP
jgi:hypothetical protein